MSKPTGRPPFVYPAARRRRRHAAAFLRGSLTSLAIVLLLGVLGWQSGLFADVFSPSTQFSAANPPPLRAPYRLPPPGGTAEPVSRRAAPAASIRPQAGRLSGYVTRIVDGDGLVLSTGEEIRLGDFNAPEWNQPGGTEAKAALTEIATGADLVCTPCEGARNPKRCTNYDRIIATCRLNGTRLGDLMRARGIAEGGR